MICRYVVGWVKVIKNSEAKDVTQLFTNAKSILHVRKWAEWQKIYCKIGGN